MEFLHTLWGVPAPAVHGSDPRGTSLWTIAARMNSLIHPRASPKAGLTVTVTPITHQHDGLPSDRRRETARSAPARTSRAPTAPIGMIAKSAAAVVGWVTADTATSAEVAIAPSGVHLVVPSWAEVWRSLEIAVEPQLSLTLTNAVIVTASLARETFPATGSIANERNLAVSSGVANVLAEKEARQFVTPDSNTRLPGERPGSTSGRHERRDPQHVGSRAPSRMKTTAVLHGPAGCGIERRQVTAAEAADPCGVRSPW